MPYFSEKKTGLSCKVRHREDGSYLLENSQLAVTVYPWLGGKIGQLLHLPTGFQPVFQSTTPLRPANLYADFSQYDTSGLDDAFPTIIEENLTVAGASVHLPDHGEIWSANFSHDEREHSLALAMDSKILPYHYEKEISLEENALVLHYTIANTGSVPFSCHWTFHGLFIYHEDMQLLLPEGAVQAVNATDSLRFGAAGEIYGLPIGQLPGGKPWDFRRVPPPDPPSAEKFWLTEPVNQGRCGYLYPHAGLKVILEYNPAQLPYLGCWITAGGFKGEYNCALEPSNGYYDSVACAQRHNRCPLLIPGMPWDFTVKIRILPMPPKGGE